jgi:arylsulfatase
MSVDAPGYNGVRPASKATLPETLRLNGYATGAFGKMHQTPNWECSPVGPFDRWPIREGFDRFYGFVSAETNQFTPNLVDGTTQVEPPGTEEDGYHVSEDLVDKAISWTRQQQQFRSGQPWFCYLPFGATHAPFHVPRDWRDRYRGEFSHGWDEQRQRTLERQRQLGVIPADAELAPWAEGAPHWDEIGDDERIVAERLMEVYAAFAEHTDAQVGRLVDHLRKSGQLDNTIIYYILGDNGASAEGGMQGTLNEVLRINGLEEDIERMLENLDEIGGPNTASHYPLGWALAMDTPYQWTKQVASHYGGTRNGLVVHWPQGISDPGSVRHQWHHVMDVAPTVLEAAQLPHPTSVNGIEQDPIEGTSMLYSIRDGAAPDRHTTQYFEMNGNRGIYHEGWTAVTKHRTPWTMGMVELPAFDDDRWELYDTTSDWTQARDLASEQPEKLAELQELFLAEAERYQVLPLDDRFAERLDPLIAGRPAAPRSIVLDPTMQRLAEDVVPNIKNTSFRVEAALAADSGEAEGVLISQGGRFGGWAIYLDAGIPVYVYNLCGLERTHVRGAEPLTAGEHLVELHFAYDGGGVGRGGLAILLVDGKEVGSGRVERTIPFVIAIDEPMSVGCDWGTPVTEEYRRPMPNPFSGRLHTVTISLEDDSVEPSKADQLQAALAEQ